MRYLAFVLALLFLFPTNARAAVAYQTHSTLSFASASSAVITKPTGLATNELLVAFVASDTDTTLTPPAGWTLLENLVSTYHGGESWTYWKIADAADVAASNFTFTLGTTAIRGAAMYRVSGTHLTAPINTSDTSHATDAGSNANAADPLRMGQNSTTSTVDNTLVIVMAYLSGAITATSLAGGSLPTMSEDFDFNTTLSSDWMLTGYHGSLGTATSFGNVNSQLDLSASQGGVFSTLAIREPAVALEDDTVFEFTN